MDYDKLLTLSSDLGYHLLFSGAEIYRVEESVRYLLTAYGVETGEVFVIPNCVIVSLTAPGQKPITQMRRVPGHGTDISRMEALNALCRRLCAQRPDLDQAGGGGARGVGGGDPPRGAPGGLSLVLAKESPPDPERKAALGGLICRGLVLSWWFDI